MSERYSTDEEKLQAVISRDPDAEGHFLYLVSSTKICCRPTCYSRLPCYKNVLFCLTIEEAARLGYRPCKRCKPEIKTGWNKTREIVFRGCVLILRASKEGCKPDIDAIAKMVGASKWHFCRLFKNYTGTTPRKYYLDCVKGKDLLASKVLPLIRTKKYLKRMKKQNDGDKREEERLRDESNGSSESEILTPEDVLGFDFDVLDSMWQQDWLGGDMGGFDSGSEGAQFLDVGQIEQNFMWFCGLSALDESPALQ